MQPTARAIEIAPGLHEGLARLREALAPSGFDPRTAQRVFTLSAGAYFSVLLIPSLIVAARVAAPGVSIRIVPTGGDLATALDEGRVDLALGSFGSLPPRLVSEPLFTESAVWIAAVGNPLRHRIRRVEDIASLPRLAIAVARPFDLAGPFDTRPGGSRFIDAITERLLSDGSGDDVVPAAITYDSPSATAIVGGTDLVALVPRRFALRNAERDGIAIIDIPTEIREISMEMVRHRKADNDSGLAWLRTLIAGIAADDRAAASLPRETRLR